MGPSKEISVLFHTADGLKTIRYLQLDIDNIVEAARRLKSERFLMADPEQQRSVTRAGLVTWGLFEVSKCDNFMGRCVLAVPTKTWDLGDDAAGVLEMYMMHRLAAGG